MTMKVNEKIDSLKQHEDAWAMIDALMGGTKQMREAGVKFLPKFPAEEQEDYDRRKGISTLYPAFKRTVSVMVGKPFAEPITLDEKMPERIEELCEDIDLQGNNLHTFSAAAFHRTLSHGLGGIYVDFPVVNGGAGARTQAEERAVGARPYFIHIKEKQLLGWKLKKENGKPVLAQLRIMECVEEDDGEFGVTKIDQVRVIEPGKWATYREKMKEDKTREWVKHDEGTFTLKKIPFVFLYGMRTEFGDGEPPLLDLAYLNVKHWQSQSDQDNITHIARVPILFIKGRDSKAPPIKIGQSAVSTESKDADMKFVEHTGQAIKAGQDSIKDLEAQMVQTGAELLVMKPGQRTATEDNNEKEGNKSDLQRIVEGFEDSIDQALRLAAEWLGIGEDVGGVKLFSDFGAWSLDQASGSLIKDLVNAGLITKETALIELQRRGILSADIDPTAELEAVEEEGPALGAMGIDPLTGLPKVPPKQPGVEE